MALQVMVGLEVMALQVMVGLEVMGGMEVMALPEVMALLEVMVVLVGIVKEDLMVVRLHPTLHKIITLVIMVVQNALLIINGIFRLMIQAIQIVMMMNILTKKSENNAHSHVGQLGSGHGQLGSGQGQLQMQNPQNAMPMQMQGQHLQGLPNLMGIQGGGSGPMIMPAPNFNQQLPMAQNLNLQQMAPNLQQPMPNPLNNQAAQAALNL